MKVRVLELCSILCIFFAWAAMKVRACWTVFYIVYVLYLSRDEGAGALDCVLYCIYSLPEPR